MKLSQVFTKTSKEVPSGETSSNAKLLLKAGFINKTTAGVYSFLPLGLRVLNKIENIIRKRMNSIGGQEILMNNLVPQNFWQSSNRWDVDVIFTTKGFGNSEYGLTYSNEETVTPIAKQFINSYKDLPDYNKEKYIYPMSIYHINTKFRNEPRAKAGLLRGREFRMKDLYDFHKNKKSQEKYYNLMIETYNQVFKDMGLKSYPVAASGGIFSDKYSHEFQVICKSGEDKTFIVPNTNFAYNQEIAPSKTSKKNPDNIEMKELEDLCKIGIIGMEELVKELGIPPEQCTKTLFYEDQDCNFIVAVVRGDYEIAEEKLQSIHGVPMVLASEKRVLQETNAKIGYAGLYNLPEKCKKFIYVDDACEELINFECGSNKTNYHAINVNWGRDVEKPKKFYDIKLAKEGDIHPETNKKYEVLITAEVGNIYDLGDKFTKAFDIKYVGEDNKLHTPTMGCHGIGTTRCMAVIADIYNDENGLKWPESVSPFKYHLITNINKKDDEKTKTKILDIAKSIYEKYTDDVIWDDREKVSVGFKMKDADLIGCPLQLIITSRSLENGGIEVKNRKNGDSKIVKPEEV